MRERPAGLIAGIIGVAVLSPDSLLLRFAESEAFAASAVRGIVIALAALILMIVFPSLRRGFCWRPALAYAAVFGIGTACFALSVKHTYIANTLVIIASSPLLAAIGTRVFIGEAIAVQTWLAAIVVAFGVLIIFLLRAESAGEGVGIGDMLALGAAASLAGTSIILRKNRKMAAGPGLMMGGFFAALICAPFADYATIGIADAGWLILNGALVVPLAFLLTAFAARRLPPPETTLLFLLETIFGSVLALLFLGELPPQTTIGAGVIILGAVIAHSSWALRRS